MDIFRRLMILVIAFSAIYIVCYGVNSYNSSKKLQEIKNIYYSEATYAEPAEVSVPATTIAVDDISDAVSTETIDEAESSDNEEVSEPVVSEKAVSPSLKPLLEKNPDTVGWLKIPGTNIDNVVCQAADNDYYLHHSFDKDEQKSGTLFADYRCDIENSDNIIIYGHKQADKTMFGTLTRYRDIEGFYEENPIIEFSDLYNTYQYKVIAYFVCQTEENRYVKKEDLFDYYNYINFTDTHTAKNFFDNIAELSEIAYVNDYKEGDRYLTLSTCSYEFKGARFVVVAKKISENSQN